MRSRGLVEFTGERVVPGQVSDDLWSEHIARYALARRYAARKHVLDCGCGTGYGTAELSEPAVRVVGIDNSADAINYARNAYPRDNTRYLVSSCLDLPFAAGSFDMVVAFEVIEHLPDFRRFLDESARVLRPDGLLIVSTPNKTYYAESRAESGPNPFHEHEFDALEFRAELERGFKNVAMLIQNRVECFAFAGTESPYFRPPDSRIDGDAGNAEDGHFFVCLCSKSLLPPAPPFVYVPRAANLLREREQHIRLLEEEIRRTKTWLTETQSERDSLLGQYRELKEELESRNRWAESLDAELNRARARIGDLQREIETTIEAYEAKVRELEAENVAKTAWAVETEQRLSAEIARITALLTDHVRLLETAEQTVVERTLWAQAVEREKDALQSQLNAVRASRWVQLGHKVGLGPQLQ